MPTPTLQDVKDGARQLLGDDEVSGGQVFTDSVLAPYAASAYREMYRRFAEYSLPFAEVIAYYALQPYARILPLSLLASNIGELLNLRSIDSFDSAAITGAVYDAANIWTTITALAHGFSDGDRVLLLNIDGLSSDINDEWGIDVVDDDSFRAAGANPSGAYTSGGAAYRIGDWSEEWVEVDDPADIDKAAAPLNSSAQFFAIQNFRLYLPSAAATRLLRLSYRASGTAPVNDSDSIGVDDSLDYMQYMTAAFAAGQRMPDVAAAFKMEAVGPNPDVELGGLLGTMVSNAVRDMQSRPITVSRFRHRRNTGLDRQWSTL